MVRVGINGLGRIGKQFLLAAIEKGMRWDFVINHTGDLDFIVYSLKYDSVHPSPEMDIYHDGENLILKRKGSLFGKKIIKVYNILEPDKIPWEKEKVDLVVECTGMFTHADEAARHFQGGAKKVLISAPAKGHDITIVYGVNNDALKKEHKIISAGSCTTNCVSWLMKVLHDNFVVENSFFVTTHAYTSTQRLIDGVDKKDLRRGRAAAIDIVPSTSGASQSVVESLPELKGKLDGYALRVPVVDGSIATVVAKLGRVVDVKIVNETFKKKASSSKGILMYNTEPIVSSDIIHNPSSCIFDATMTQAKDDMVSVAGWYDNEWGYSNRLVDVTNLILKRW